MDAINLQSTNDKFVISIDKNMVDKVFLFNLLERLRVEYLAKKVNFDDGIVELGEDIKSDWWQANKKRFIQPDTES